MNCLFKISVAALIATGVTSCGVLEPATDIGTSSVALPAPTVTPVITAGGTLVTSSSQSGADRPVLDSTQLPNAAITPTSASTDAKASSMAVSTIFQTDRCNQLSRGGFIWFTDTVVLDDWLSPLEAAERNLIKSKVDFSTHGALLLDYGVAGTSGVGATVMDDKIEIKGQDGIVKVKRIQPPKGKKTVQVVTHPCSLHVMPRKGFSKLVILSDMDDLLTSFENK